jgi:acyl carrier protein
MLVDTLRKVMNVPNDSDLALRLPEPNTNLPLAELGLDSLDVIEWCMEIEARTGVKTDPADLITHGSVDELVSLIVDRKRAAGMSADATQLVRVPRGAPLPLSLTQERSWKYSQTAKGSAAYWLHQKNHILGPLDVAVFRDCLSYIVGRHETLRTTFAIVDGQPAQVIHPAEPVALPVYDLTSEADPEEAAARIIKIKTEEAWGVDLTQGPLVRFLLIRIRENEHWWLRISHHILGDAWSARLLLGELACLYTAKLEGAPPPLPETEPLHYADYATWQRMTQRHNGPAYQDAIAWWKERFQQQSRLPDLPFKRSAPLDGVDPTDGVVRWPIDSQLAQRLSRLGRNEAVTTYVVWLAALVALLADETGEPDVVVGTYMTNRRRAEVQNMMGDFTNLTALRFQCDHAMSFRDWLSDVKFWVTTTEARCEIPYEELREELQELGVTLPEVRLIYLGSTNHARAAMHFAGLSLSWPDIATVATMPWGVTMYVDERNDIQEYRARFNAGIHDPAAVRQFIGRLCELLDAGSRHPDLSLGELLALHETL